MTKKRIVTLQLIKSWNVNCVVKYQLEIPSKNDVRRLMAKNIKKMEGLIYAASE
jgi:ribosomal protein S24E